MLAPMAQTLAPAVGYLVKGPLPKLFGRFVDATKKKEKKWTMPEMEAAIRKKAGPEHQDEAEKLIKFQRVVQSLGQGVKDSLARGGPSSSDNAHALKRAFLKRLPLSGVKLTEKQKKELEGKPLTEVQKQSLHSNKAPRRVVHPGHPALRTGRRKMKMKGKGGRRRKSI